MITNAEIAKIIISFLALDGLNSYLNSGFFFIIVLVNILIKILLKIFFSIRIIYYIYFKRWSIRITYIKVFFIIFLSFLSLFSSFQILLRVFILWKEFISLGFCIFSLGFLVLQIFRFVSFV